MSENFLSSAVTQPETNTQNSAFNINLDDQLAIKKNCRAPGTVKLYDGQLQTFIEYLAIGNYTIDYITSHHPILICDYLKDNQLKPLVNLE